MGSTLFKSIRILLIVLVVSILFVYFFQRLMIYFPFLDRPIPKEWGAADMQEIELKTADGLLVTSWYKPAQVGHATFIYLQGNAGHIGFRMPVVRPYLNKGYGVLLLGYRGYGGNQGYPSEQGLYKDLLAGWQFLQNQKIPGPCIVLIGESLGTGLAVQFASEHQIGAVVLLSPYTSLVDVGKFHYPFFPVDLLLKDRYESLNKIASVKAPLFILVAENDVIVPAKFGETLYQAAHSPKELFVYPGVSHDALPGLVQDKIMSFVEKYVACPVTLNSNLDRPAK